MATFNFNPSKFENLASSSSGDFQPIPAGNYLLDVSFSQLKQSRAGAQMLAVTFDVADGDYSRRKIFQNFVIGSSNETARNIALGQLSELCKAAGLAEMKQDTDLIGARILGHVVIRKSKDPQYGDSNQVVNFAAANAKNAAAAKNAPKASSSDDLPPWER